MVAKRMNSGKKEQGRRGNPLFRLRASPTPKKGTLINVLGLVVVLVLVVLVGFVVLVDIFKGRGKNI